jgi:integrase/recombinase XerD
VQACGNRSAAERRDRLIILILYGCGLRTSELCDLNVKDIDIEKREILVKGKGDLHRMVPIPERVYTELLAYLHRIRRRSGALFKTEAKKCRINTRTVSILVGDIAKKAGIAQKVTPRTLRHSYATHLMDSGVDLSVISCLMGHRSPSQTGVYLHALKGRVDAAVRKLDKTITEGEEACTGNTE